MGGESRGGVREAFRISRENFIAGQEERGEGVGGMGTEDWRRGGGRERGRGREGGRGRKRGRGREGRGGVKSGGVVEAGG